MFNQRWPMYGRSILGGMTHLSNPLSLRGGCVVEPQCDARDETCSKSGTLGNANRGAVVKSSSAPTRCYPSSAPETPGTFRPAKGEDQNINRL
jgi:hypothetical protein